MTFIDPKFFGLEVMVRDGEKHVNQAALAAMIEHLLTDVKDPKDWAVGMAIHDTLKWLDLSALRHLLNLANETPEAEGNRIIPALVMILDQIQNGGGDLVHRAQGMN